MDKVSQRKQNVLDALDTEIEALETKLEKVQPLINELQQLRRTRATLLSEKGTTGGGVSARTRLTMEQVIHAMREADGSIAVGDLATGLGVGDTVIRSHLNRYRDERYRKNGDGTWELIGEDDDGEE